MFHHRSACSAKGLSIVPPYETNRGVKEDNKMIKKFMAFICAFAILVVLAQAALAIGEDSEYLIQEDIGDYVYQNSDIDLGNDLGPDEHMAFYESEDSDVRVDIMVTTSISSAQTIMSQIDDEMRFTTVSNQNVYVGAKEVTGGTEYRVSWISDNLVVSLKRYYDDFSETDDLLTAYLRMYPSEVEGPSCSSTNLLLLNEEETYGNNRIKLTSIYYDRNEKAYEVRFLVNNRLISYLNEGQSWDLDDDTTITVHEIINQDYAGGIKGAYFCLNGEATDADEPVEDDLAVTLANIPELFTKDGNFNGYFVVGSGAPAIDNLAMTDIAAIGFGEGGVSVVDATKLDSEVNLNQRKNLIVIGRLCENDIVDQLLDEDDCDMGDYLSPGQGLIRISGEEGNVKLWVTGYTAADTRMAAKALAQKIKISLLEDHPIDWSGTEVIITDPESSDDCSDSYGYGKEGDYALCPGDTLYFNDDFRFTLTKLTDSEMTLTVNGGPLKFNFGGIGSTATITGNLKITYLERDTANNIIVIRVTESSELLCGDSAGGDGWYSTCRGDTVKHNTGLKLKAKNFNKDFLVLKIMGTDQELTFKGQRESITFNYAGNTYKVEYNYYEPLGEGRATIHITHKERDEDYCLRSVMLSPGESFNFATGEKNNFLSKGDLYLPTRDVSDPEEMEMFFANNVGQRGVASLGNLQNTPLESVIIPKMEDLTWQEARDGVIRGWTKYGVKAKVGHTYAVRLRDGANPVAFRVVNEVDNTLKIRYLKVDCSEEESVEEVVIIDREEVVETEEVTIDSPSCSECRENGNCLPFGTRLLKHGKPVYCDLDGKLKQQKDLGDYCQNNCECLSNQCSNGQCVGFDQPDTSRLERLLERLINLLERIFR